MALRLTRSEFLRLGALAGLGACVGGGRMSEDPPPRPSGEGPMPTTPQWPPAATAAPTPATPLPGTTAAAPSAVTLADAPRQPPAARTPGGPLLQYPHITQAEIDAAWPGFSEALPPNVAPDAPIIDTSFAALPRVASANPGRRIRVTHSDPGGLARLQHVSDVEILIPGGVSVGTIRADEGCMRVRVRGEGPDSRAATVRVGGGAHCTFHSLMIRGTSTSASMRIAAATGPVAFISCIGSSVGSSASDIALHYRAQDVLIAGCNLGADGAGGKNDWCLRFDECKRVVVVDTFCEARGKQPVIRRSSGSSQFLFKRVTTYNAADDEAIADNGVGSADFVHHDCHLHDCVSYVGGRRGMRFGGYNRGQSNGSGTWRVHDHTFHSIGARVNDEMLAAMEGRAGVRGDWKYRLGQPRYVRWDGKSHPGWPTRVGFSGKPMAISDPYRL